MIKTFAWCPSDTLAHMLSKEMGLSRKATETFVNDTEFVIAINIDTKTGVVKKVIDCVLSEETTQEWYNTIKST